MGNDKRECRVIDFKSPVYNATEEFDMNFIGERIAQARTSQKLTLKDVSASLKKYGVDIAASGISKWEVGKTVPNAYQFIAVAHVLSLEDDMSYFFHSKMELNREGQEKLAEYKKDLIASGRYKPVATRHKINYVTKMVSYLPASAGTGAFLDEGSFEECRFPESAVPVGADFALYVRGDSMEPVYHDGQVVWVQKCEELNIGDVGIFVYDGCGYIKSYDEQEPDMEHKEIFTDSYGFVHRQKVLISYNEDYDPIVVSPEADFRIVGKVL